MDEAVQDLWHVFSDGTRTDIPFLTEEDKTFAWNSVAICAMHAGLSVWTVTVNDTHLHMLVNGKEAAVLRFRDLLGVRQYLLLREKELLPRAQDKRMAGP